MFFATRLFVVAMSNLSEKQVAVSRFVERMRALSTHGAIGLPRASSAGIRLRPRKKFDPKFREVVL
jgi:hypothetical protein